jgi:hypothetical protein
MKKNKSNNQSLPGVRFLNGIFGIYSFLILLSFMPDYGSWLYDNTGLGVIGTSIILFFSVVGIMNITIFLFSKLSKYLKS